MSPMKSQTKKTSQEVREPREAVQRMYQQKMVVLSVVTLWSEQSLPLRSLVCRE